MSSELRTTITPIRIEKPGFFRRAKVELMVQRGADIRYVNLHEFESLALRHSIDPAHMYILEVER